MIKTDDPKSDGFMNPMERQGVVSFNANPILDTRVYEFVFPNGEVTDSEYGANVIAENMWAPCDLDGKQT